MGGQTASAVTSRSNERLIKRWPQRPKLRGVPARPNPFHSFGLDDNSRLRPWLVAKTQESKMHKCGLRISHVQRTRETRTRHSNLCSAVPEGRGFAPDGCPADRSSPAECPADRSAPAPRARLSWTSHAARPSRLSATAWSRRSPFVFLYSNTNSVCRWPSGLPAPAHEPRLLDTKPLASAPVARRFARRSSRA
mgnify:CR=1 FL=1